jgi:hypothetical protein
MRKKSPLDTITWYFRRKVKRPSSEKRKTDLTDNGNGSRKVPIIAGW